MEGRLNELLYNSNGLMCNIPIVLVSCDCNLTLVQYRMCIVILFMLMIMEFDNFGFNGYAVNSLPHS